MAIATFLQPWQRYSASSLDHLPRRSVLWSCQILQWTLHRTPIIVSEDQNSWSVQRELCKFSSWGGPTTAMITVFEWEWMRVSVYFVEMDDYWSLTCALYICLSVMQSRLLIRNTLKSPSIQTWGITTCIRNNFPLFIWHSFICIIVQHLTLSNDRFLQTIHYSWMTCKYPLPIKPDLVFHKCICHSRYMQRAV